MSDEPLPQSEILLYQTEDGRTRIQCRLEGDTLWLTQKLMADFFQIGVGTVNHHLKAIFAEGELEPEATIRRYRIVQHEGSRDVREGSGNDKTRALKQAMMQELIIGRTRRA